MIDHPAGREHVPPETACSQKEEKMLQNINVLVKAPEPTGNTKLDLEAQQRFNRQLLRALEYLLEQIDRELEEGKK